MVCKFSQGDLTARNNPAHNMLDVIMLSRSNPVTFSTSCVLSGVNVAKYGVATQSTLAYGGHAEKAIDGNKRGDYK